MCRLQRRDGLSWVLLQPWWPRGNDLLLFFYSIFVNMYGNNFYLK